MKRNFSWLLMWIAVATLFVGCQNRSERTIVILSTNDMHSQIDGFPALASAVKMCRDTADVILVDGGDKFTGNAFVDLVEYHTPIFELMNKLEYDVSVYGNHEFDWGTAYISKAVEQAKFDNILANVVNDSADFVMPKPYSIVECGGLKVAFVGVVGNDDGGHPSGKASSYEGLTFINPDDCAAEYRHLKDECDMLILLSHAGDLRDREYAASKKLNGYDMIIGAHSHEVIDEEVNGIKLTQTGSRLKNIGAIVVTMTPGGKPQIDHRNISLKGYSPDEEVAQMVDGYYHNPELTEPIGKVEKEFSTMALQNLFTSTIRDASGADIGIYNSGGIRLDKFPEGDINTATILNVEPFSSRIALLKMTTDQLKTMIITKFNDKVNIGESHYIDLNCSAPYTVITGKSGDAVDVIFPTLKSGKIYTVAMGDYVAQNYKGLDGVEMEITETKVAQVLKDYVCSQSSIKPDNTKYQIIK
ncbi:MAG: 5'-nucleotidase C-terminal domain-containing protein [Rikenellaceae bacterium]